MKPRAGERVLDLATGTGITAIAARERGTKVTAVDLTPELLAVARKKAETQGFSDIDFREGDAEALPFDEGSFDLVVSTCGHMFAPDQPKVASELARVTRRGGRVVFLAWAPDGGLGGWFRITNKHVPPPAGVASLQGAALEAFRNEMLAFLGGYRAADGKVRWGREYLITCAIRA